MPTKIKDWGKFQHFKDRRPPWIKLYRDILDDPEWFELDPEASKALVMLWLIASEADGYLPDIKKISFRLRISEQKAKSLINKLSHWLDQDDIKVISDGYQSDAPETERETEREENQQDKTTPRGTRLPADWTPSESLLDWAKETRSDLDLGNTIESFRDFWLSKAGKDGAKLDWDATFRNWVRNQRASPVAAKAKAMTDYERMRATAL